MPYWQIANGFNRIKFDYKKPSKNLILEISVWTDICSSISTGTILGMSIIIRLMLVKFGNPAVLVKVALLK